MKILKYILLLLLFPVFWGCNETEDPFYYNNQPPVIYTKSPFKTDYSVFETDSVKFGSTYKLDVVIKDEGKTYNSVNCTKSDWETAFDGNVFNITPSNTGEADITITSVDVYGEQTTRNIHLTCFNNIPPVAKATCDVIAILDPYERKINALSSIDPDAKYGGGISAYEFTISGVKTAVNDNGFIYYVFQGPGDYRIKIRVRDNDGVWSDDYYFTAII